MCFDNGATELKYTDETSNKKCKFDKTVKWLYLKVDYKDYIKNFEWNARKYNQKLPLLELCGAFTKVSK